MDKLNLERRSSKAELALNAEAGSDLRLIRQTHTELHLPDKIYLAWIPYLLCCEQTLSTRQTEEPLIVQCCVKQRDEWIWIWIIFPCDMFSFFVEVHLDIISLQGLMHVSKSLRPGMGEILYITFCNIALWIPHGTLSAIWLWGTTVTELCFQSRLLAPNSSTVVKHGVCQLCLYLRVSGEPPQTNFPLYSRNWSYT